MIFHWWRKFWEQHPSNRSSNKDNLYYSIKLIRRCKTILRKIRYCNIKPKTNRCKLGNRCRYRCYCWYIISKSRIPILWFISARIWARVSRPVSKCPGKMAFRLNTGFLCTESILSVRKRVKWLYLLRQSLYGKSVSGCWELELIPHFRISLPSEHGFRYWAGPGIICWIWSWCGQRRWAPSLLPTEKK